MVRRFSYFMLAILVIVSDQASKTWVLNHFIPYDPYPVFSMLNITLAFNTGAAFSFLSGPESWHAWFFIGFALLMSGLFICWIWQLPSRVMGVAYGLILGGALSNLWDRLTLGQVIDFIDVFYHTHHWPVFNVADSAICVGVVFWVYAIRYVD